MNTVSKSFMDNHQSAVCFNVNTHSPVGALVSGLHIT